MSTSQREGAVVTSTFGLRPVWFWTGAVMWTLVLGGLAFLLWNRRERAVMTQAVAETAAAQAGKQAAAAPVGPGAADAEAPVADPQGDVIDLSALMGQSKPVPDAGMWDPEGIEDFAFTNSDGRTITRADLLGRPWAICFVFTKCLGPCPTVTRQMRMLQDRLKDADIRLVTLTVDPARDTPEVLAKYAKLNGADPERWFFLTGDQTEIYGLIHRSFKMPVQEVEGPDRKEGFEVIHSTNVMLVDENGVVRGKFNAAKEPEMAQLRRELEARAVPIARTSTDSGEPVADGR